jgi:hypothetical protein
MRVKLIVALLILLVGPAALGQEEAGPADVAPADTVDTMPPPRPVTNVEVHDKDNDHGHATVVSWDKSPDDGAGRDNLVTYEVFRWVPYLMDTIDAKRRRLDMADQKRRHTDDMSLDTTKIIQEVKREYAEPDGSIDWDDVVKDIRSEYLAMIDRLPEAHERYPEGGEFRKAGRVMAGETTYDDTGNKNPMSGAYLPDYADLYYRVDAVAKDSTLRSESDISGPVQSSGQWFNTGRTIVLIFVLIFGFLTIWFVQRARAGADLYIRPIGGIEAVDEAIGRATEMGRPILYVLGLGTAADVATIASFTILERVAKRVAEYQTELIVPTYDPIVLSVAEEVVKSAFMDAGRPDAYDEDMVFFVTQSQFAYVAAVNGIMLRQRPATNVYMGMFHAESLLLAETGAEAGAIQISGTDQIAQLPFFIVACDYTLIGEELYAASAYLGREPVLLGSLKAQDYAKAAVLILALIGLISANAGVEWFPALFEVGK